MRVLLVNPKAIIWPVFPAGLAYIASYLRLHGHQVDVLDLDAHPLDNCDLDKKIASFGGYDCIGISALVTAYDFVKMFSRKIKSAFPKMPVIVGNLITSSCPETLLKNTGTDVIVVDEGELTALELIEHIRQPDKLKDIKGIWYKDGGRIYKNAPRERIENLDALPYPARDLLDMEVYIQGAPEYLTYGSRTDYISTVRGCPYSCGYCSHGYRGKVFSRSVDSILQEIRKIKDSYDVDHVTFNDDLFLPGEKEREEFCRRLIEEKFNIGWSCSGRVNLVNDRLLKLMKESGCTYIGYGVESASQIILNNMNKRVTVQQAENAIRLTQKNKITPGTAFIIGYFGETLDTIKETVEFIKRLRLPAWRFFFATPIPGTQLYEWARENGKIKHDEDTYLSMLANFGKALVVNLTDFTDSELIRLKKEAERAIEDSAPLRVKFKKLILRIKYCIGRLGLSRPLRLLRRSLRPGAAAGKHRT